MQIVESPTSTARNVPVSETALATMKGGQEAIGTALTATHSGTLLDMAQISIASVLGKAARIHGRTTGHVLESGANPWPVGRAGGMPVEGSLHFAALRRCAGEAVGGRFHARQPASGPTAIRCPPHVACRQDIGAIASRPDPGIRQLRERSAALKWETGGKMDRCRRRCGQRIGPMPRQASGGDRSAPRAAAPAQNPVSHNVPHDRGRVDAPPCDEVANCR